MDQTTQRVEALKHARDILQYLEHGADELIVVADWIVTGTCDAALAFNEATARHYRERPGTDLDGLDPMRWSPTDQ